MAVQVPREERWLPANTVKTRKPCFASTRDPGGHHRCFGTARNSIEGSHVDRVSPSTRPRRNTAGADDGFIGWLVPR